MPVALEDNYSQEDILIIEDIESGYRLDESKRKGLKKLKQAIESNKIEIIYLWEASRLARRMDVFRSISNYILFDKKIQIFVKGPKTSYRVLNDDGSINEEKYTLFSLEVQHAEFESDANAERVRNKRQEMESEGHPWGTPPFGYRKNIADETFEIDESKAKIIRRIFDDYIKGIHNWEIADNLQNEGIIPQYKTRSLKDAFISTIINRDYYAGDNIHPAIITKEQLEKARNRYDFREADPKSGVFLLRGLIRDKNTGGILGISSKNPCYIISQHTKNKGNLSVRRKSVDPFVWIALTIHHSINYSYYKRIYLERLYENLERQKAVEETAYGNFLNKCNEYSELIKEKGSITDKEFSRREKNIKAQIEEFQSLNRSAKKEKEKILRDIESGDYPPKYDSMTTKEKIALIQECIKCVSVERLERYLVKLEIEFIIRPIYVLTVNTKNIKVIDSGWDWSNCPMSLPSPDDVEDLLKDR